MVRATEPQLFKIAHTSPGDRRVAARGLPSPWTVLRRGATEPQLSKIAPPAPQLPPGGGSPLTLAVDLDAQGAEGRVNRWTQCP